MDKCIKSLDTSLDVNDANKDDDKDHVASCIDSIFDTSNMNYADDVNASIENLLDNAIDKNDMENQLEHNELHNNANNGNKTSVN